LGFFRVVLGKIGWEGFTGPTRSRAMARTSFDWSNFVDLAGFLTRLRRLMGSRYAMLADIRRPYYVTFYRLA
jgi:hypothetical protein